MTRYTHEEIEHLKVFNTTPIARVLYKEWKASEEDIKYLFGMAILGLGLAFGGGLLGNAVIERGHELPSLLFWWTMAAATLGFGAMITGMVMDFRRYRRYSTERHEQFQVFLARQSR